LPKLVLSLTKQQNGGTPDLLTQRSFKTHTHTQRTVTHSPKLGSTKVVPPVSVGTSKLHIYTKRVGSSCSEVKKKKKKKI
jgi:hypothetical protein